MPDLCIVSVSTSWNFWDFSRPGTRRWRIVQGWGSCRLEDLVTKLTKLAWHQKLLNLKIPILRTVTTCISLFYFWLALYCLNDHDDDLTVIGWFSMHWKNSPVNMMIQPSSQLLHLKKSHQSFLLSPFQLPSQPSCHSWPGWVPPWDRQRGCRVPPSQHLHSRPTSRYSSCFLSNICSLYIVKGSTLHSRREFRSQQSACNRPLEYRRPLLQKVGTARRGRWLLCGCSRTAWSWQCHTAPANKLGIVSAPENVEMLSAHVSVPTEDE